MYRNDVDFAEFRNIQVQLSMKSYSVTRFLWNVRRSQAIQSIIDYGIYTVQYLNTNNNTILISIIQYK